MSHASDRSPEAARHPMIAFAQLGQPERIAFGCEWMSRKQFFVNRRIADELYTSKRCTDAIVQNRLSVEDIKQRLDGDNGNASRNLTSMIGAAWNVYYRNVYRDIKDFTEKLQMSSRHARALIRYVNRTERDNGANLFGDLRALSLVVGVPKNQLEASDSEVMTYVSEKLVRSQRVEVEFDSGDVELFANYSVLRFLEKEPSDGHLLDWGRNLVAKAAERASVTVTTDKLMFNVIHGIHKVASQVGTALEHELPELFSDAEENQ